jgi:hypothetical protein
LSIQIIFSSVQVSREYSKKVHKTSNKLLKLKTTCCHLLHDVVWINDKNTAAAEEKCSDGVSKSLDQNRFNSSR